jgi:hypothetical protein
MARRTTTFSFEAATKSETRFSCVTARPICGSSALLIGCFKVERSKTLPKPPEVELLILTPILLTWP